MCASFKPRNYCMIKNFLMRYFQGFESKVSFAIIIYSCLVNTRPQSQISSVCNFCADVFSGRPPSKKAVKYQTLWTLQDNSSQILQKQMRCPLGQLLGQYCYEKMWFWVIKCMNCIISARKTQRKSKANLCLSVKMSNVCVYCLTYDLVKIFCVKPTATNLLHFTTSEHAPRFDS